MSPLANRYLQEAQLSQMEPFYPLHVYVCERCLLVQIENCESPEVLFGDYSYFSSFSDTWLEHAKTFAEFAERRFGLNRRTQVIEFFGIVQLATGGQNRMRRIIRNVEKEAHRLSVAICQQRGIEHTRLG